MKVVAINGSPKNNGNTAYGITVAAKELADAGIEVEVLNIGTEPVRGCIACGKCYKNKNKQCVFNDDITNSLIAKMVDADGIILAAPTYFAGLNGTMKSFLDRAFYVHAANGGLFRHKIGASISAVRRAGATATIDQLNRYMLYAEMPIVSSNYWDVIYGAKPGDAEQDAEGNQTMRILGKNMAWMLQLVENGNGVVAEPEPETKIATNFIR
jgi:multimeric flavodoxin WrbA